MYYYLYSRPLWLISLIIISGIVLWSWISTVLQTQPLKHRRLWLLINSVLLLLSLYAILFITLLRRNTGIQIVYLRPFHSLLAAREQPEIYRELLMNVFLFVPFGLALSQLLPRKRAAKWHVLIILPLSIALSTAIEWVQYRFALGTAETDDVICNALGTFLGALPILMAEKMRQ